MIVDVEQNRENSLSGASVLDHLLGEEDLIQAAIFDDLSVGFFFNPLEQEN